tara:strand:+ start:1160 stop:1393 length:234 start_codon:yes stop_codon:yes gene_type:complete
MEKQCNICSRECEQLKLTKGYKLLVCAKCWLDAEKGWANQHQEILFEALKRNGLLIPDRNHEGLLPRDYLPPKDFNL